jgi:hydrogenase maturation protease
MASPERSNGPSPRRKDQPARRTLILGFGNPDREDDGVALHILIELARRWGYPLPDPPEDGLQPCGRSPELMFVLQLSPELVETLAQFDRVCFVDANTGEIAQDILWQSLKGELQTSPLTHHMTPAMCLALTQMLSGRQPEAVLVSVRGHAFGFANALSPQTAALADQALQRILAWASAVSENSEF